MDKKTLLDAFLAGTIVLYSHQKDSSPRTLSRKTKSNTKSNTKKMFFRSSAERKRKLKIRKKSQKRNRK